MTEPLPSPSPSPTPGDDQANELDVGYDESNGPPVDPDDPDAEPW